VPAALERDYFLSLALMQLEDGPGSPPISPALPTPNQEYPDIGRRRTNFDEEEVSIARG